jgi:predicted NBD/HSP70 family sugar kinase
MVFGGIELGGTKIICAVGLNPADLRAEVRFPTRTPHEALAQIIAFFQQHQVAAVGICTLSPQRIILGGGIMKQSHLFPRIQREVQVLLNGYIHVSAILQRIDRYIVPPSLGSRAGILGTLALAEEAALSPL